MPVRKHCIPYELLVKEHGLEYKSGTSSKVKNGDVNKAIKSVKRKVISEGIVKKYQQKMFFESGSERKRRERAEARARWQRQKQRLDKIFNGEM